MISRFFEIRPISVQQAIGATAGQESMMPVMNKLATAQDEDHLFILDLAGVSHTNGSFLKATVFWALQCGQADVQGRFQAGDHPWSVRALKFFPLVKNCEPEVIEEVAEFFEGRSLPIIHLEEKDGVSEGKIIGALDDVLERTLKLLIALKGGTASDLATASSEKISVNGWNNRLADLYAFRLVTRQRKGKFWIYSPTIENLILWA